LEQPKNCSKPLSATEATTYFEFVLALQAGGHRFDPGHVHQPNQHEAASLRALRRSVPKGIQDGHVKMREITFVSSSHGQAVDASCGGDHGILP
jgi:hypothetical protein